MRLVLLTLVLLLAAVTSAAAAGVRPHVELSDSMRPSLRAGDVLWLDAIRARDAAPGDVVAFRHQGRLVLHRVRAAQRRGARLRLVTRGDANRSSERVTVAPDASLGRYVGVRVPLAGRLLVHLRSGPLALAAALLLALIALRAIWARPA